MNENVNGKVSIIVPVYNAEKTLQRCIESIVSQTYGNWELCLIDDGSCDTSGEICDRFSERDVRIHVVHKENEGVSVARNVGIEKTDGEYLMFVDSDDYLEGRTLEAMVGWRDKCDADVIMCGFFYHSEENGEITPNYVEELFVGRNAEFVANTFREALGKELLNPPWNKIIRRRLIELNNIRFISDYSICEDMIFTMELLKTSERVVFLNEPLYHYVYKKGNNLVNKFHKNFYEALSAYYGVTKEYLKKCKASSEAYSDINKFYVDKTISYFKKIYSYGSYDRQMKYCELKRICEDLRDRDMFRGYKPTGSKKKIVCVCIRYKWYRLLHLLYMMA